MSFTSLTNHYLIAMPGLTDPHFYHSVSYLCEHSDDGAIGIVINRPMNFYLSDVLEQMEIKVQDLKTQSIPVYYGGPIAPDRGFVIHTPEGHWRSTLKTAPDVHVTTSHDILEAMAIGQGPQHAIVALGYAGWDATQLDTEIAANVWLSVPVDPKIMFETSAQMRWQAAAQLLGIDITTLSGDIGHA